MKSFLFLLLLTISHTVAFAQKTLPNIATDDVQPNFTVPLTNTWLARYEKRQTKMVKILGLNTQQKRSLDTFNDRYVTQRAILQEDKSLNVRTRLSKNELMRRERDAAFRNILNAQQLAKWNDLRKVQKKKAFRKK
jgi:hypothetical protein